MKKITKQLIALAVISILFFVLFVIFVDLPEPDKPSYVKSSQCDSGIKYANSDECVEVRK